MSSTFPRSSRDAIVAKNLVGFMVGDVAYAIDIHRVSEILRPLPTLELPHTHEAIVGVADHRGEVVPVVDLRRRFGLPPATDQRSTRWIVVKMVTRHVALAVDRMTDVFGPADTEPEDRIPPRLGPGDDARGVAEVYRYHGQLIFVLDVDRITDVAKEVDVEGLQHRLVVGKEPLS